MSEGLCNCCQTIALKQAVQELDELVEYQTRIIQQKDSLIKELTKENKSYKEVINKWKKEEENKIKWGYMRG